MPYEDVPDGNVLLAALRPAERERVLPELTEMQMDRGAVLCEAGEIVRYAWFPCNGAVAAFTVPVEHEGGVETAMVGREGVADHNRDLGENRATLQVQRRPIRLIRGA